MAKPKVGGEEIYYIFIVEAIVKSLAKILAAGTVKNWNH